MLPRLLLIAFLAVNALFWGLAPHSQHCLVARALRLTCISHDLHKVAGVACFLLATYLS